MTVRFPDTKDVGAIRSPIFLRWYIVKVDKDDQKERQPENAVEALAKVEWVQWSMDLWQKIEDWKPMAILLKAKSIGVLP